MVRIAPPRTPWIGPMMTAPPTRPIPYSYPLPPFPPPPPPALHSPLLPCPSQLNSFVRLSMMLERRRMRRWDNSGVTPTLTTPIPNTSTPSTPSNSSPTPPHLQNPPTSPSIPISRNSEPGVQEAKTPKSSPKTPKFQIIKSLISSSSNNSNFSISSNI